MIDQRTKNWADEIIESGPKDLLGLMIQEKNLNSRITVNDIAEECKTFFFAGEQTTSNLLTWTTVLLAMHPEWQALARDEVLKVVGSRDSPTKDDVVKLKTVSLSHIHYLLGPFHDVCMCVG